MLLALCDPRANDGALFIKGVNMKKVVENLFNLMQTYPTEEEVITHEEFVV